MVTPPHTLAALQDAFGNQALQAYRQKVRRKTNTGLERIERHCAEERLAQYQ
jgi:hypothetical protein